MTTRRTFVASGARWMAGLALGPRLARVIPLTRATARSTPAEWLPPAPAADLFRSLATQAIDAAHQAGVAFADIRIGERRRFRIQGAYPEARVATDAGYGVRVLVDGTWGMGHGETLTADAVTTVVRRAVGAARASAATNNRVHGRRVELARTPAVTGEWTSPVHVSPFTVPIDDHGRVIAAWRHAVAPIYGMIIDADIAWEAATRVVASSEGTLITQHLTRVAPTVGVAGAVRGYNRLDLYVPTLVPASAGFEAVMLPGIPDQIRAAADDAERLIGLPERPFDATARFPVVLNGAAAAALLGATLGQALDGDRVAGFEADAAGRSFIAANARGAERAPLFSPLVTVTADRAAPAYTAVQWDDEGVVPSAVTLVERGRVRAFLTTRESATLIEPGAASTGSAVAPDPTLLVMSGGAHLALAPASAPATLETLMRDVSHGVLCYDGVCLPEPGVSTGLYRGRILFEVRQGKPVSYAAGLLFQFQTRRWWSDRLRGLGGAETLGTQLVRSSKGMPWQEMTQVAAAPAMLLVDVDVVPAQ